MVHYKHIMQHNWLGYKPVQKWYQSHGSEPWEKPIHKHDQVVHTRRYLQRETPKRLFPWNSRKKSLSPESKEMLVKKMKEVEVFNASKMSAKTRDHGKKIASTQKEKRARIEKKKKSVKPTNKNVAEKIKYPEKVHVITDYMIEGTDDAIWDEVWYVSSAYKNHMCPTRPLFKKLTYKFKMIEKEEIEKKFIFSYGVRDATVEAREGNLVIPNINYTPKVTLNVLSFDLLEEQGYTVKISNNKCNLQQTCIVKARTGKAQEESFTEDDGSKDVVTEHNKFLDEYFESIDPKEYMVSLGMVKSEFIRKFLSLFKSDIKEDSMCTSIGIFHEQLQTYKAVKKDMEKASERIYKKFYDMVTSCNIGDNIEALVMKRSLEEYGGLRVAV
ncbi:hypothetical protein Tco_1191488 [Tanacetum coccineum]